MKALSFFKKYFFLSIFLLYTLSSCIVSVNANNWGTGTLIEGSGVIKKDLRNPTTPFESVSSSGFYNVYVSYGTQFKIEVEADDNLLEYIITEVKSNGTLEIKSKKLYRLKPKKDINVYVTLPQLKSLSLAGSGDIELEGNFSFDQDLNFSIAGSGDIIVKGNYTINKLNCSIAGSGDIKISGQSKCDILDCSIAGSGDIKAQELKADNVQVSIAGSGNVYTFCNNYLNVSIVGSGDVFYYGQPQIKVSKVGSGDVISKSNITKS
ncbi:MAG: head GIN domain-containing protein [Alphaproteobacteria bacterium]|nr:head GIN domain-containing protein [Alphaproteobacteria bacterium]